MLMQHMLYYAIIREITWSHYPRFHLSSAAAQQESHSLLQQNLLLGSVKGLQMLEASPPDPTTLSLAELPAFLPIPPFSHQTTHTLPSSRDAPQSCKTSLILAACSHLQTCKITSFQGHSGPNWPIRGYCNSAVSQACLQSRSQTHRGRSLPSLSRARGRC